MQPKGVQPDDGQPKLGQPKLGQPKLGQPKDVLGRWGEDLAVQHLTAAGLRVLARNWRCREGELDVVAREPDGTVVFVEVKTRSTAAFGQPAEAVSHRKAARVRALACRWLADNPSSGELRFDVVSVVRERGTAPVVEHLRGAF